MLSDDLILKDILRCFDDPEVNKQQKHVFHLVYASKKQPVPAPTSKSTTSRTTAPESATVTTDGLRQRNVLNQTNGPVIVESSGGANAANMFNFPGGPAGPQYFMAQQMAMHNWMQQVYWQYMNQYMNS